MQKDYSKQASYVIKYGIPLFLCAILLGAYAVFSAVNKNDVLTVKDAEIAGTFVSVKAQAKGVLASIEVEDGSKISAGDPLATVEVAVTEDTIKQLEQNVTLAKENLEKLKKGQDVQVPEPSEPDISAPSGDLSRAEARRDRMEELFKMGAISKNQRDEAVKDYEAAKSRVAVVKKPKFRTVHKDTPPDILESAEINVRQAEAALKRAKEDAAATEITSPIDGTFYLADVSEGSEIQAGERLFSIGDPANMWIEARLSGEDIQKLRLGQLATYTIDGKKYSGTITEIEEEVKSEGDEQKAATEGESPKISGYDGKRIVKISLPNDASHGQKPGSSVTVEFKL